MPARTADDTAPGLPTDCVLAKSIRAHITTLQLAESFVPSSDDILDWRYEVANGDTRLSLDEWVMQRREEDLTPALLRRQAE